MKELRQIIEEQRGVPDEAVQSVLSDWGVQAGEAIPAYVFRAAIFVAKKNRIGTVDTTSTQRRSTDTTEFPPK